MAVKSFKIQAPGQKVVKKLSCLFTKFVPVHLIEMSHVFVKNKSLLFFHKEKKTGCNKRGSRELWPLSFLNEMLIL
jgi:hypothetical protein